MAQTEGDFLRSLRKRYGMSQEQFAERVGTTQAQVARWEKGDRSPTVKRLREMLNVLGLDLRLQAVGVHKQTKPEGGTSEDKFTEVMGGHRG
jgi:transcriptional regulator with XRE-family HTH domain